jgi:histidinol-phosphate/aromatic aminotransferase/cobyric acid decarboxylase-like protein/CTP:phosphocholine cytidylyltransferase-like protein
LQALILAAGMGNRLGEYTRNNTKCMVDVGGRTMIQRAADALKKCGIRKVTVVAGYMADGLIAHVKSITGIEPEFIINNDYDKTNNIYSLYLARDVLIRDDTILLESDLLFDDTILKRLAASKDDVTVVDKYTYWMDGTTVLTDDGGVITEFVEKKDMNHLRFGEYYKTVNMYKLTKEFSRDRFVPEIERYIEKNGRGAYYELVLKVLASTPDSRLKALRVNEDEKWYEIDDPRDLDVARTMFSCGDISTYTKRYGGFWRFPRILDFCYLVNPYFPPEFMIADMSSFTRELLTSYPSGTDVQSLNAGVHFGIDPKNILVGNGAAELINEMKEFVGRTVGVCVPTFEEYIRCFPDSDIRTIDLSASGYRTDADAVIRTLDDADTFVIISPGNPCGDLLGKEEMIRILEAAKEKGKRVVFDESFIDFADEPYTLLDQRILTEYPGLAVIKSISKSYGVPGVRLGVLATSDVKLLEKMRRNMSVWNINSFGEFFLQIIGKYAVQYRDGCDLLRKERKRFAKRLSSLPGLKVYPSQANYFLCELESITAARVTERLLNEYGILIKDLTGKNGINGDRHIRVAIRGGKDNDVLIDALKNVLAGVLP